MKSERVKLIENLTQQIKELSYDDTFGVLTRGGLKQKIKEIKKPFNTLFIDITNLKGLNTAKGYSVSNKIIKRTFSTFNFRQGDIIGRLFSGDEIIIICKHPNSLASRLKKHFINNGLSFKHKCFYDLDNITVLEENLK